MPKRNPHNLKAAPLLDELRSIEACAPEQSVPDAASLCLLRVVTGLDGPTWTSLSLDFGLEHWCAVPLLGPIPKTEVLAQAIGQLGAADSAPGLRDFLSTEIERSRACRVPLALALIQPDTRLPDADQPGPALLQCLLEQALDLKRSFDHAAHLGGERLALVFSGASLAEAERMVGAILRRIRAQAGKNGAETGCGVLCSAGLAGYGGYVEFRPDDLIRRAGQALDSARGLGGNRLEVAPPADVDMAPRDTLVRASEKHFLFTGKKAGDT
ncbi:MAG: GGDEF domain-containing protein [Humidesulfovibrio sp.]|nr:GGDEF domain-containing protein [Humidesulfovibrio sp.]